MPADAAGHGTPPGLPRALPGAGDPTAPAAAPQAGDITRSGSTRRPAAPGRSPAPDPARITAPAVTQDQGR